MREKPNIKVKTVFIKFKRVSFDSKLFLPHPVIQSVASGYRSLTFPVIRPDDGEQVH